MLETRVLGRIFGSKRNEVTGGWKKLHNEELNELYCSPDVVRVIKLRRWTGHVARRGKHRCIQGFVRKLGEKDNLEDPNVDERIILKYIFRKWDMGLWTGSSRLRIGRGGGHF
jgi:hypothetical protein